MFSLACLAVPFLSFGAPSAIASQPASFAPATAASSTWVVLAQARGFGGLAKPGTGPGPGGGGSNGPGGDM